MICRLPSLALLLMVLSQSEFTHSFGLTNPSTQSPGINTAAFSSLSSSSSSTVSRRMSDPVERIRSRSNNNISPTALNVWWFGGSQQDDVASDDESCELVAVRIERPTSNSRKIAGELSVRGVTIDEVWSILTDYNQLSIHVPNLRESRVVRENNNNGFSGEKSYPGDGSYKCQLYQVGAQKIIGFDFSASVTMDMTERIVSASTSNARKIYFKCVDSQFFSEFDGAWTVQEQRNSVTGEKEVLCSYDVVVKPKGPVPVAALEWRIREDVPTNLRAVKAATIAMYGSSSSSSSSQTKKLVTVGDASMETKNGATATLNGNRNGSNNRSRNAAGGPVPIRMATQGLAAVMVDWERGETMAKYLE